MRGQIYKHRNGFMVRFGRDISKWFKTQEQAERFLTGLRFEMDTGKFNPREYASGRPLSFTKQAQAYQDHKAGTVKPSSLRNIKNYLGRACAAWGDHSVTAVNYGMIEDLLRAQSVSEKTRHDMSSCIHAFFTWLHRREIVDRMPRFPTIRFELGWRTVIDLETQAAIITEVGRISGHISPKIHLGIRWLSTYFSIRPAEMLSLRENQINHKLGCFIIPNPKERKPKVVPILDEDLDELRELPRGLPDLYFFRHDKTANGAKAGQRFGQRMFYKWWSRACMSLGVEGVDLYGGTKHSTVTALGQVLSPEQIRHGSMHKTNAAFERYFQGQSANAKRAYGEIKKLQQSYNDKGHPKVAKVLEYK